jgi:hypothetical protein
LRGHFQFHGGCDAPDVAHVRAAVVVGPGPLRGEVLSLPDGFDDVLIEPFMQDGAVVALDVGVLLRQSGLECWIVMPRFSAQISRLPLSYSPILGQFFGLFKLQPAPADRFRWW